MLLGYRRNRVPMLPNTLYIIGNGFDRAHGMETSYGDFYVWLVSNGRLEIIQELQDVFNATDKGKYLLWSDFETALGQFDVHKVSDWGWENICVTEVYEVGEDGMPKDKLDSLLTYLNFELDDIVNDTFSDWVRSVKVAEHRTKDLPQDALYLTFNYTDTLEQLYQIPETNVCHIHGRASKGEKLIVGHNHPVNPSDFWKEDGYMRDNNERMQRFTTINNLVKPYQKIIESNESFFSSLSDVNLIQVIGHSCNMIDFPYFKKVKESVSTDAKWVFESYRGNDNERIENLVRELNIKDYTIIQTN